MLERHCEYIKDDKRCNAWKVKNSQFCFVHSPSRAEQRKVALKKASEARKIYLPIDDDLDVHLPKNVNLTKSKNIKKAYVSIIRLAFSGSLDKAQIGVLIYALNGYCAQLEKLELMERVEKLEAKLRKGGFKIHESDQEN